jgi:manganese transport protein
VSATAIAVQEAMTGQRRGLRAVLPMVGPAVIASVAYMDPGNFATNIQAGARYGYALLWVVLGASAIAMLFQALSARLGIVTGRNLAEVCRDTYPRPVVWAMWAAAELGAIATDLAEFIGAAIAFSLLLGLPLLAGMGLTAVVTFAILTLDRGGFRPLEIVIACFVGVIGAGYLIELVVTPPVWGAALHGLLVPGLPDAGALTLAVGIVGATVMPHAIYLHSGLTQGRVRPRDAAERGRLIRFSNREVVAALSVAACINLAMVAMAASAFHPDHQGIAEIEDAYRTLVPLFGRGAGIVFLLTLLASGLSSSAVGTLAGQIVMQGFLRVRVPLWVRRACTMLPAFAVIASGWNPTQALVISQVVLSLVLPLPMITLLLAVGQPSVMGDSVPGREVRALAWIGTIVVLAGNVLLVLQTLGVAVPGLAE